MLALPRSPLIALVVLVAALAPRGVRAQCTT